MARINKSVPSKPKPPPARAAINPSKAKKKSLVAKKGVATLDTIRDLQDQGKSTHGKAANTTKKYTEYVKRGREWLASHFNAAEEITAEGDVDMDGPPTPPLDSPPINNAWAPEDVYEDPAFKEALNDKPNKFSDKALALYISYKCFHDNRGISTADGSHAAFKHLWKNSDGDTYRGKWAYNDARGRWEGNPAESAEVRDVMEAIKHKSGAEGGDRKHALAMSKEYMEMMACWSETVCPKESLTVPSTDLESRALKTKHLLFRALSSLAWTIWARNFEIIKLQKKDVTFGLEDPAAYNAKYTLVHLVNRKGWQHKVNRTQREPDLRSNKFKIYAQPDLPACDAFRLLSEWIEYLENEIYQRPLGPDDYIFPAMGANGVVHPREPISHDTVQKWINDFTLGAQIPQATGGSFSTHCFRRGGAQYRFMFAPVGKRWTLRAVRWWGGWAEGEHRDTLLRYLLDELQAYEEDYSGALCPVPIEASLSHLGEHRLVAPASTEEVRLMHGSMRSEMGDVKRSLADLVRMFWEIRNPTHQPSNLESEPDVQGNQNFDPTRSQFRVQDQYATRTSQSISGHTTGVPDLSWSSTSTRPLIPMDLATNRPVHCIPHQPYQEPRTGDTPGSARRNLHIVALSKGRPLPLHTLLIPDIPLKRSDGSRSPRNNSWREIVEHWENGDVPRGLHTPLKDWAPEWLRGANKIFAQKHFNRGVIATEFLTTYKSDEAAFLAAYPQAQEGQSRLLDAINIARLSRGDRVARKR